MHCTIDHQVYLHKLSHHVTEVWKSRTHTDTRRRHQYTFWSDQMC